MLHKIIKLAPFILLLTSCGSQNTSDDSFIFNEKSNSISVNGINVDHSRARNMKEWTNNIQTYSNHHYGENSFVLDKVEGVVLHYTDTGSFPWNLVNSTAFEGEKPGLGCHFVVDGTKVYQILPLDVRGRCVYGANHRTVSIEIVALGERDLFKKTQSMLVAANIAAGLLQHFGLSVSHLYSHQEIDAQINKPGRRLTWVMDKLHNGSGKTDPGVKPMKFMTAEVEKILNKKPRQVSMSYQ